jgi:serine/threonine protein kinase
MDSDDDLDVGLVESLHDREANQRYSKERKVGEGTYAVVYEGHDRRTGKRVALKRIKMTTHGAGLDISAIRELKYLAELQHPNIVKVIIRNGYNLQDARCILLWKELDIGT